MELKTVIETEKRITEVLSAREKDLRKLGDSLEELETRETAAMADMEKATEAANTAEYKKAKAKFKEIQDEKEMLVNRINSLNDAPLVTEAEFKEVAEAIYKEFSEKKAEAEKLVIELVDKLYSINKEYGEAFNYTNVVLGRWQRDIFRFANIKRHEDGRLNTADLTKNGLKVDRIDNQGALHCPNICVSNNSYYMRLTRNN